MVNRESAIGQSFSYRQTLDRQRVSFNNPSTSSGWFFGNSSTGSGWR